jgi:hypothetical protein
MAVLFAMASKVGDMRFSRRDLGQSRILQGVLALALFALACGLVQYYYGKPVGLLVPLAAFLAACGLFVFSKQEISWLRAGLPRLMAGSGERSAGA